MVFIVYAHMPDGSKFALIAFDDIQDAQRHIQKCTRNGGDDYQLQSAAEMLGISALTIEPLTVVRRK